MSTTNESMFSKAYLDLQAGICCSSSSQLKLLRWVGCTPGIYKGDKTVFSSSDLGLCNWAQLVTKYSYDTVAMDPGENLELSVDCKFIMVRVAWPIMATEAERFIEIGINKTPGAVGMTIPFVVGPEPPDPPEYTYYAVRDLFIMNTPTLIGFKIYLNNVSTQEASVGVFAAK